jgi:helix-turn-helix protein
MGIQSGFARRMWHHVEAIHAYLYYAPEVFAQAEGLGFAAGTRWPSYFAWRLAPLGAAGRELGTAVCYSFSPAMVAEHVPAAWQVAPPADILQARLHAMDLAYRALPGELAGTPELAEAAGIARRAAEAAVCAGRPLAAANADQPWPEQPHLVLWQAITLLREHRGDGHIAALLDAGLDPCESLVSFAAVGAASEQTFTSRGWTPAEWGAARERLASRGLIDADGQATEQGRDVRNTVELRTDQLALGPWAAVGTEDGERLAELTTPLLIAILQSGLLPGENTLGIGKVPAPVG